MCPKVGAAGHIGHTATHAQRRDQITMMCPKVVEVGHRFKVGNMGHWTYCSPDNGNLEMLHYATPQEVTDNRKNNKPIV